VPWLAEQSPELGISKSCRTIHDVQPKIPMPLPSTEGVGMQVIGAIRQLS
jgi:hypothetical protein